jgi:hypothetical protein
MPASISTLETAPPTDSRKLVSKADQKLLKCCKPEGPLLSNLRLFIVSLSARPQTMSTAPRTVTVMDGLVNACHCFDLARHQISGEFHCEISPGNGYSH